MSDYALTKLYSKGGGGEHFFSHFSCFPSRFSTYFFACLSRLSFLQYLLADGGDEGEGGVDGGVATHSSHGPLP